MPLIKCHECKKEISDEAAACVGCGAPVKKPSAAASSTTSSLKKPVRGKDLAATAIVAVVAIWLLWPSSDSSKKEQPKPAPAEACKSDDLRCLGEKGTVAAGVYCPSKVERLAKHSVRWVDGTFEMKFSHFRWRNKDKGEITYLGDKAEFQNGFGAYTRVIYECDFAADGKTILDVRVREGRLP